jgi:hypothetical protein
LYLVRFSDRLRPAANEHLHRAAESTDSEEALMLLAWLEFRRVCKFKFRHGISGGFTEQIGPEFSLAGGTYWLARSAATQCAAQARYWAPLQRFSENAEELEVNKTSPAERGNVSELWGGAQGALKKG